MNHYYGGYLFNKHDIVEFKDGSIRTVVLADEQFAALITFNSSPSDDGNAFYHYEDFKSVVIFPNNPFFRNTIFEEIDSINGEKV